LPPIAQIVLIHFLIRPIVLQHPTLFAQQRLRVLVEFLFTRCIGRGRRGTGNPPSCAVRTIQHAGLCLISLTSSNWALVLLVFILFFNDAGDGR
jgi:hypothetical protein